MKVKVSAPGKLMLFGEHAVVYGHPCIVTAVDQRLGLKAETIDNQILQLIAPDVGIDNYQKPIKQLGKGEIQKEAKWVEISVKNFAKKYPLKSGVNIQTQSQFKSTFGFGSSSATAVCTIKALARLFNKNLTNKQIFELSYKTVLDIQGVGSGFDVAAAIWGGTLLFETGGVVIKPIKTKPLPLVVGYSEVKADTATIVKNIAQKMKKYPHIFKDIYNSIENLVLLAEKATAKKDLKKLGELMDINQGYLETIGVSSQKLSSMVYSARLSGAFGAKLSGAGIGDCMIALAPKNRLAVEKAIEKAGGQVLKVKTNAQGVKIEN